MNIAIYDLDKTVTRRATFTPFLLFFARRIAPWRLLTTPLWFAAMAGYRIGLYGRKPLKRFGMGLFMGRNIPAETMSAITQEFVERIVQNGLQPGAVERIEADRKNGAILVLATAAPEFYAKIFGRLLGFRDVVATRSVIETQGQFTNRIDGENCYAGEKLRRIQEWIAHQGINREDVNICFYSDDISDRPTLDFANQGFAINPSAKFAQAAQISNWGILDFRQDSGTARTA